MKELVGVREMPRIPVDPSTAKRLLNELLDEARSRESGCRYEYLAETNEVGEIFRISLYRTLHANA